MSMPRTPQRSTVEFIPSIQTGTVVQQASHGNEVPMKFKAATPPEFVQIGNRLKTKKHRTVNFGRNGRVPEPGYIVTPWSTPR